MVFRPFRLNGLVLWLLTLLGGCSASYQDAEGRKHYIGLVDVTIDQPAKDGPAAITSRSLGLALFSRLQGESGVALGYSETVIVTVPNDSCIDLRAPGLCSAIKGEKQ